MIARTPAAAATPLLRHAAEAHQFAEVNMLLKAACLRGHLGAAEALRVHS